jgi:uncharacterized membrane protein YfcA
MIITQFLLLITGIGVTSILTMVGLGGGILFVPILVLIFGFPTHKAIGASLLAMSFTTTSATLTYVKQKRINYKIGLLLDALDFPGAIFGAWLTTLITPKFLAFLFGTGMLIISILLAKKKNFHYTPKTYKYKLSIMTICLILFASFMSGLVAGMLGAGGGTVDESMMVVGLGMPVYIAAPTSIFGMALTNIFAVISHFTLGNVLLEYAIPLAIGGVIGGQLGAFFSKRIDEIKLRKILIVVFIVVAFRMVLFPYLE